MYAWRLSWALAVAFMLPAAVPWVQADELTDVYALILKDPANSELNLQYAMIAEGRKEYRKALAAYERVLLNDPNNAAAQRGLQRMKRIIEPQGTVYFADSGITWQTNPYSVATGADDEFMAYSHLHAVDEHLLGDQRWRTIADFYGEGHAEHEDLDYGSASLSVGPIIDIPGTDLAVIPALGGAAAYFDEHLYYGEGNASATVERSGDNDSEWMRLRAGYRQYDPFFTADDGFYADLFTRYTRTNVLGDNDAASIAPWARWSGINGTSTDTFLNDFAPGKYITGGVALEYSKIVDPKVTLGAALDVSDRYYFVDLAPGGDKRQDFTLSPSVSVTFNNLFATQSDLRFDYEYDRDFSNDPTHSYDNHSITMAVVTRR